jgi:hypothetical protein
MTRVRLIAVVLMAIGAQTAVVAVGSAPAVAAVTSYQSLPAPQRLLDTRVGETTADGQFAGQGARPAGSTLALTVANRVGLPADPAAVVLNITVTEPVAPGFVTAFPCDQPQPTASSVNYVALQTVPNAVIASVGSGGDVCLFTLQQTHLIVDVSGWFPDGGFVPLGAPQRLLDTRPDGVTADGAFVNTGAANFSIITLPVRGRAGVPNDATSIALNVTVTAPGSAGFLTVFPCGAAQPNASNLNFQPGQTVANLVITKIGDFGAICLYVHAQADVVVDASGTLPDAEFQALPAPQRLLDTRSDGQTADGQFRGDGAQPAGATFQLRTAGRAGIPADATAVVLNVTVVSPAAPGFVTVHPRGSARPTASNLNHLPGAVVANVVIARVGPGGDVCLFSSGSTHLVVDVAGWLTGPAPAASGPHCPSLTPTDPDAPGQLVARLNLHSAVGIDYVAVLACDVAGEQTVAIDPGAVAQWANEKVAPYFEAVSGGLYRVEFSPHPLGRIGAATVGDCVFGGRQETGPPFTNVLVVDSTDYGGGQAGPGLISSVADVPVLTRSPNQNFRGAWVGGGAAFVNQSVVIHEIGHTIHWPHSFTGQGDPFFGQYDNPVDVMSGQPRPFDDPLFPQDWCPIGGGAYTWCEAQGTLAFNRMAAGWVAPTQVAIHRSGRANYSIDRAAGGGLQLVALPDPGAPLSSMVIDARPTTGPYDQFLAKGGVTVHLVDQGSGGFNGISVNRRQAQAVGPPESYAHVIAPGESFSAHGVTVSVLESEGGGYLVTVNGQYHRPGSLLAESTADEAGRCDLLARIVVTHRCWK